LFSRIGPSGFGHASTAEQVSAGHDLSGRHYLVTGSNSGLGLETIRVLSLRGATVIAAARTEAKARAACEAVAPSGIPVACELADPASVRACVAHVQGLGITLDGVITNAGIMALPERELLFGHEKQLFVNHVGHFILVTGLLDTLAPDGRVVVLSSSAHQRTPGGAGIVFDDLSLASRYTGWDAYGQSKLANMLFARELSRRLAGSGRTAVAVHPGVIATNLGRHLGWMSVLFPVVSPLFFKSIPEGAATQVWAATMPAPETLDGQYCYDCNVQQSSAHGADLAMARRLWEVTEGIVAAL
jgi:NAD(P)-dependent dehydrogenase (short-subunit alcohol dehydrogenase family)